MTTIAWDGESLAADRRTSFGGLHAETQKIHRIGRVLAAGCGVTPQIAELMHWIAAGAEPSSYPSSCRDVNDCPDILVICPERGVLHYSGTPFPIVIRQRQWAIGSGRDFAMAAMWCGKTAREAVEVAAVFDTGTGNGVDVEQLDRQ